MGSRDALRLPAHHVDFWLAGFAGMCIELKNNTKTLSIKHMQAGIFSYSYIT